MEAYFQTENLAVGYYGKPLIQDIAIALDKGKILTLIGPNGAGKSTILKSVSRQLALLQGRVLVQHQDISAWTAKETARQMAVVLTDRIRPELMTCAEVVAMGRYPYTNLIGKLTDTDKQAVSQALRMVHAYDLADREFATLSDGQRQRILLARAICQEPEILVLDEPTAYLDIRHKIELLEILRDMAASQGTTILMSLHEIDLAMKISDYLLCVKCETIVAFCTPEEILGRSTIEELYEIQNGSYNPLFGSVELSRPTGTPEVFVIAGAGFGTPFYRTLQKRQIPFATGILFENDIDYQVAAALSDHVAAVPAFAPMEETHLQYAAALLAGCALVLDAGTPMGELNKYNKELLLLAEKKGIPICHELPAWKIRGDRL